MSQQPLRANTEFAVKKDTEGIEYSDALCG